MKRILLVLSCLVLISFAVLLRPTSAQQTVTDEVAIIPLPVPANVIGTFAQGASNDGKRIVFASINNYNGRNVDSNKEIYVYDVDTRAIIQITDTEDIKDPADTTKTLTSIDSDTPVISGDGTKIAFVSNASLGGATNDDANFEVYLADLPLGATTATVTRITDTGKNNDPEVIKQIFNNYGPTINDNGNVIAFTSTRRAFNAIPNGAAAFTALPEGPSNSDPDGNGEIFIYNVTQRQYSQVTVSRDVDATVNFVVKGFNSTPILSGNGQVLIFISGFNYPGANANNNSDFNGEIFLYRIGDPNNTFTQITNTTGTAIVPTLDLQTGLYFVNQTAPVNLLPAFTHPLDSTGSLLVFESAGNFDNGNADRTRELWLYNVATKAFTRLTNQTVSATPTQDELRKIDYNMFPNINSTGTTIAFASVLNLTPASSSSVTTDNADGSREVFRYDIATNKFRQLTFTPVSGNVFDQRDASTSAYVNDAGNLVTFSQISQLIASSGPNISDLFQALIRPVTSANAQVAKLSNAASFDVTQIARGSLVAAFGTQLSNTSQGPTSPNFPFDLNGVTVTVGGLAARIIYISPGQVNFVMPPNVALGDTVTFTINNNGLLSSGTVKVVNAAPGVFSVTADGKGVSVAQCGGFSPDGKNFLFSNQPCSVGNESQVNFLIIYGTGWRNATGIQVKIGDQTLTPAFAGAQPDFPGLDQINVQLTKELAGKLDQEITVTVPATTTIESNKTTASFLPFETALTVINAASFESGTVATNSLAAAQGTELANSTQTPASPASTVDGVTVTVAGAAALITSISPTQVNFFTGNAPVSDLVEIVVNNNGKVSRGRVKMLKGSPGVFTTTNDGNGRATAQCGRPNMDGTVTFTDPPCSIGPDSNPNILRIFGTGWRDADNVTLKVGDVDLTPTFKGALSGATGIDIIDAKLVPGLAGRADVDVVVTTTVGTTNKSSKAGIKISFNSN